MKKVNLSSSLRTTGRLSKEVKRTNFKEEGVKAKAKCETELKNVVDGRSAVSGTLPQEVESTYQDLKQAMRQFYLVEDTLVTDLKDLHELKAGSALHQNLNLVLQDPL